MLTEGRGSADHLHLLDDDSIIVAGNASIRSSNLIDAWVARYSKTGDQLWSIGIDGVRYSSVAKLTVVGDKILVVGTHGTGSPYVRSRAFLAAISTEGELLWETHIEEEAGSVWGRSLIVLNSGEMLVSAGYRSIDRSTVGRAAHYSKITRNGELIWSRIVVPTGGHYDDIDPPNSYIKTKDGKILHMENPGPVIEQPSGELHMHLMAAEVFGTIDGDVARCVVISPTGEIDTQKDCIRLEPNEPRPNTVQGIKKCPGCVVTNNISIQKLDEDAKVKWEWTYKTEDRAGLTDYVSLTDGGVMGTGYVMRPDQPKYSRYDAVLFRLDSTGNEVWVHTLGARKRDILSKIVQINDEQFCIVGHTGSEFSQEYDPWIMRIGLDGELPNEAEYD